MKRYWVVQFLAEERHGWDIAKDIRLLFGDKVHGVNCVPHLEDLDGDAIQAPPEKQRRAEPEPPRRHRNSTKGGALNKVLIGEMERAQGPVRQRDFYPLVRAAHLSDGNIIRALQRMEYRGEVKRTTIKGRDVWELIRNGIEKDQAAE